MRNAKQILEASIKEIDTGGWICDQLCTLKDSAKDKTELKPTDFMGCAIGLLSIYGGSARQSAWWVTNSAGQSLYVEGYIPEYPDPEDGFTAVHKAVKALALATPKPWQKKFNSVTFDEYDEMERLTNLVTSYNDQRVGGFKTKKGRENQARKWFLKAIDLLPSIDGKIAGTANVEALESLSTAF